MNKVMMIGRLTHEVNVYTSESGKKTARYSIAVNRKYNRQGEPNADFFRCVCLNESAAEFASRHFYKGLKIAICGRLQTGSYVNRAGAKVYTTDIIIEEQSIEESRKSEKPEVAQSENDFMNIPDDIDSDLPFA